jgi:hypothetical protein
MSVCKLILNPIKNELSVFLNVNMIDLVGLDVITFKLLLTHAKRDILRDNRIGNYDDSIRQMNYRMLAGIESMFEFLDNLTSLSSNPSGEIEVEL